MAGLECDKCLQPTRVIDNGKTETDADGRVLYRRYRVCTNPTCPRYKIRRESVEVWLPDQDSTPFVVSNRELNLEDEPAEDPWQMSLFPNSSAKPESPQSQSPKELPPKRK